jgi:hypothetical protein
MILSEIVPGQAASEICGTPRLSSIGATHADGTVRVFERVLVHRGIVPEALCVVAASSRTSFQICHNGTASGVFVTALLLMLQWNALT